MQVEGNNHKPEEKAIVMLLVGSNNMRITRVWLLKLNKEQMAHIKIPDHGLKKLRILKLFLSKQCYQSSYFNKEWFSCYLN